MELREGDCGLETDFLGVRGPEGEREGMERPPHCIAVGKARGEGGS